MKFEWKFEPFHSRKFVWKRRLETAAILSRPQSVKTSVPAHVNIGHTATYVQQI